MFSGSRPRSITIWLALAGYVLVASGVPLPLGRPAASATDPVAARRLAGKDRSRPFPCMNKPCGCTNARQCFTRCCCHTPSETLAWARANGVDAETLAALELRAGVVPSTPTTAGCCIAKARPSCCENGARVASGGVTSGCVPSEGDASERVASEGVARDAAAPAASAPDAPAPGISLRALLACGGMVTEWLVAGAALPPPAPELSASLVVIEPRRRGDRDALGTRASPETPPPRAA